MGTKLVLSMLLAVAGTSAAFNAPTTMPSIAGARMLRSPMSTSVKMQCAEAGTEATWKGDRRGAIMATGSALVASFFLAKPANAVEAAAALQEAKKALVPVKEYIKAGEWDKCRTALNNPPLGFTGPKTIKGLTDAIGKGNPAAKGMATDMLTNQRLLDTFCYNNVFIDDGREALGVKKDFKTPMMYYKATITSLDELIELVGE